MTASVLKQDPNTKRFKRTLIYFDTVLLLLSLLTRYVSSIVFNVYLLSVVLWLDKGHFSKNVHTACPCQNK